MRPGLIFCLVIGDQKNKFIDNAGHNSYELYDLSTDPDERKNLVEIQKDFEQESKQ